ncbi:hypothetical protein BK026_11815 [Alteromonas sp. V450]|uniref:hypothetical protein n=1 Tax=Alteromonas sp. V450 TaxID=1912139 RepID=UPI0008FF517B|nr:hypothetical protein [Alteromonas sp. V450]OJF69416.1 hypothetical protein BK026_11815 [Alteromonas sp. V450]
MSKLLYLVGAVVVLLITLSFLSHRLPPTTEVALISTEAVVEEKTESTQDWQAVLKSVPSYFKTPDDNKAENTKNEPKRMPTEARLIAVVNLDNVSEAAGVFVLPGEVEPKMFKAGETWLAPWEISSVNANFVTWVNTEDNTEVKQRLF